MCASAGGEWQCEAYGPMAFKGFPPPEVCDYSSYSYSYSYDPFMPCPDLDSAYLTCVETADDPAAASAGLGWSCCGDGETFPTTCAGMQTYSEFQDACGDPAPECAAEWSTYVECVYATALDLVNEDLTGAAPLNCDLSCTPPDPTPRPVAAPAPMPRPTLALTTGVISKAVYPDTDPTCSGPPVHWIVEAPNFNTDGACQSLTHPEDGQTYSQSGSCASATSFSSNLYQGDSCSGSQVGTWEKTDDDCVPIYDASSSYSYSYSYPYGDLDGYAKWGCPDIPAADVAATLTFYHGSDTCNDADDQPKNYQITNGACVPEYESPYGGTTARTFTCDADGVHMQYYPNGDCSGSPDGDFTWLETDTCTSYGGSSMKATCGCAAGVGCSTPPDPTPRPTVAPVPAPTPRPTPGGDSGGNGGAETASAGLIGGVVAGVAVLAALSFATYWYMRSKGSAAPEAPYAHEKNEIAYDAGKV